ncbi:NADPH-dependent FMN reductase [Elongatibacter sediminis]|uniref:NADPH-dependent FMN reductase n=1 Tax=Elongatibacter sediminis TaxID=3119006 RepID=A0AAW9RB64_9GAMM
MKPIIALSGSLRAGSLNSALLRAAQQLFPDDIEVGSIAGIPLYNGDVEERDGVPESVERLKDRIAGASGLLLATPEYNNAMPGVFKNAIDWLSRPPKDIPRVFHGKPVAVMGATPGGFGTNLAQNAWWPVLRTLKTRPWFEGRLMVSRAPDLLDDDGQLTDSEARARLQAFVGGFIAYAQT